MLKQRDLSNQACTALCKRYKTHMGTQAAMACPTKQYKQGTGVHGC